MEKDLNKFFRSPPKGGNGRGVPTQNPMSPNPPVRDNRAYPSPYMGGGGLSIEQQREARQEARMSPEQRMQAQMAKWNEPPRPATGPGAQTSLRTAFENGEASSRTNCLQSGQCGQPEFRNYDRGKVATQEVNDPSGLNSFDWESTSVHTPAGTPPVQPAPRPLLNPDTRPTYGIRSDGKPTHLMPEDPNQYGPNYKDGALQDGTSRDNPAHDLGRNCGPGMKKY